MRFRFLKIPQTLWTASISISFSGSVKIPKDLISLLRQIHKASAFNRLHNYDRLTMLFTDLVDFTAFHGGIFVIHVIELNLYNLDFRMFRQYHIKDIRFVMERNAKMADFALLF